MILQLAFVSCVDSFVIGVNVKIPIFKILNINELSAQFLI